MGFPSFAPRDLLWATSLSTRASASPFPGQGPACLHPLSWVAGAKGWAPSVVHLLCLHLLNSVDVHWGSTLN